MNPTRVIVTGDRSWWCHDLAEAVVARLLARYGPGLMIVHGACPTGVDKAFDEAAEDAGVPVERHPADWDSYGRGAGPRRNEEMARAGASLCLAVHKDIRASKGTKDCARRCIAAGMPVWLIDGEDAQPKRLERI